MFSPTNVDVTKANLLFLTDLDGKRWNIENFYRDGSAYRSYRGVIEGIFGGLETRRLLFTRYKKINENKAYKAYNCHDCCA